MDAHRGERSPRVVVVIKYRTLPGEEARGRADLAALIETVVEHERDCRGIVMLQGAEEPDTILLIEHWSSRAAYQGPHMQQPHLLAFIQQARAIFAGPPEITYWHTVSAPGPDSLAARQE